MASSVGPPSWINRAPSEIAVRFRGGWLAPIDLAWTVGATLLAHAFSPVFLGEVVSRGPLLAASLNGLCFVIIGQAIGLYDLDVVTRRERVVGRAVATSVFSPIATLGVFYLILYEPIGRRVVLQSMLLGGAGVVLARAILWALLRQRRRRVLFAGSGGLAEATAAALDEALDHPYEVLRAPPDQDLGANVEQLAALCRAQDVDEVVLPLDRAGFPERLPEILRSLPGRCQVRSEPDFHEDVFRKVPVLHVPASWVMARGMVSSTHLEEFHKRTTDIVLALLLLVASLPVAALATLLVALGRDGPIFFSQTRVGRHGRTFQMLKFRTMRTDAEDAVPRWAEAEDPRRTRVGRLLRPTRIDELPQLINILMGDMSFVGPRPERPEFMSELETAIPFYACRHLVRPGLTGWAQIHHPYGSSVEDTRRKLEFDLYYLRRRSPFLDLVILLRTGTRVAWGGR